MGVQFSDILVKKEIKIEDLAGKIIVVDAFNHLYQFLSTIRQRDGTPLMDSRGGITSHLAGLFSRTTNLMEKGIRLAYVFDGEPPKLKKAEQERRGQLKKEAEEKYRIAAEKKDIEDMKKYASRTSRLTQDMVDEAKKLIEALGLPVIQAPSEGEAQAAFIVKNNDGFAVSSQDSDSLIFGSPRLIRNLSISGRRKKGNKFAYEQVAPELIDLEENLRALNLDQGQLLVLAILVGTDYNFGGIKGIGPKHALKLLYRHARDFDAIFREVKWDRHFEVGWKEIYDLLLKIPITLKYKLAWQDFDEEKIRKVLVDTHNFSEERISSTIEKLRSSKQKGTQKGLGDFF